MLLQESELAGNVWLAPLALSGVKANAPAVLATANSCVAMLPARQPTHFR